jgi:hypothetical protein
MAVRQRAVGGDLPLPLSVGEDSGDGDDEE